MNSDIEKDLIKIFFESSSHRDFGLEVYNKYVRKHTEVKDD